MPLLPPVRTRLVCVVMISVIVIIQLMTHQQLTGSHQQSMLLDTSNSSLASHDLFEEDQVIPPAVAKEIPIFYNLFIGKEKDVGRIKGYFHEQAAMMLPGVHRMFISLIASFDLPDDFFPVNSSHIVVEHRESGTELVSLHKVWEHCQLVPDDQAFDSLVVYLHDKGSLHKSRMNNLMRAANTKAALSEPCTDLPDTCNVCSMRFSPLPYPHVAGNMWIARCSYLKQLMEPSAFQKKMTGFRGVGPGWGKDRFALEAYIHHHNEVRPCDVLPDGNSFAWSYTNNRSVFEDEPQLKAAPRFAYDVYKKIADDCKMTVLDCALLAPDRLDVHNYIQGSFSEPPLDWWGYDFYPDAREQIRDWVHNHTISSNVTSTDIITSTQ